MHAINAAELLTTILALAFFPHPMNRGQIPSDLERLNPQAEALLLAARDNDVSKIASLIAQGIDVNASGARGATPLMSAAGAGSVDAVRYLIRAGADPNCRAPHGKTALSMAIEYFTPNHSERNKNDFTIVVRELIAAGAEINVHDDNGLTPLLWASAAENEDIARVLLEAGADVNARSRVRIRPGHYLIVTPLIYAVINSMNDKDGSLALIRLLLERGADVTAKDTHGTTALMWAERLAEQNTQPAGETEVVSILRKSGAARR